MNGMGELEDREPVSVLAREPEVELGPRPLLDHLPLPFTGLSIFVGHNHLLFLPKALRGQDDRPPRSPFAISTFHSSQTRRRVRLLCQGWPTSSLVVSSLRYVLSHFPDHESPVS